MKREDLIAATRAYLADWADDGATILSWRDLVKYGFDPVWLTGEVQDLKSGVGTDQIYGMQGILTLAVLYGLCEELGLSQWTGEIMGRGTRARILTRRIQVALGDAEPPKDELHPEPENNPNVTYAATIHGGMWEVIKYSPKLLAQIRELNRLNPGEIQFLGIFPTEAEAFEICERHVPLERHLKRSREVVELLRQLAELRRERKKA